ncbi:MAG TPA: FeoB-associated Cys-rich membrane protein [Kiritimatiellia bacterium]|nr:FeoB-associated Cys-rich membrane protein [Kiritimatiellia bacterium]
MTPQLQNIIVAIAVVTAVLWLARKLWKRRSNPCEMCSCAGKMDLPKTKSSRQSPGDHSSVSDGDL